MWRNWQTRRSQKPVMVTSWRFKSSHPHQCLGRARKARPFHLVWQKPDRKGGLDPVRIALAYARASDTICIWSQSIRVDEDPQNNLLLICDVVYHERFARLASKTNCYASVSRPPQHRRPRQLDPGTRPMSDAWLCSWPPYWRRFRRAPHEYRQLATQCSKPRAGSRAPTPRPPEPEAPYLLWRWPRKSDRRSEP